MLAIFENADHLRFAIHMEVKHLSDEFSEGQAAAYPIRARCWIASGYNPSIRYDFATTAVFFSEQKREEYSEHLTHFDTKITWEELEQYRMERAK